MCQSRKRTVACNARVAPARWLGTWQPLGRDVLASESTDGGQFGLVARAMGTKCNLNVFKAQLRYEQRLWCGTARIRPIFGTDHEDGDLETGRSAECRILANCSAVQPEPLHRLFFGHGRQSPCHPTTASRRLRAPRNHQNLCPFARAPCQACV